MLWPNRSGRAFFMPTPPAKVATKGSQENQRRGSYSDSYSSLLAEKGLVFLAPQDVNSEPLGASGVSGASVSGSFLSPRGEESAPDCLVVEREILKKRGLSEDSGNTLLASRKKVTSGIHVPTCPLVELDGRFVFFSTVLTV